MENPWFEKLYSDPNCSTSWNTGKILFEEYYLDLEDSNEIVNNLICEQFDDDNEEICKFCHDLHEIIDRSPKKVNVIL